MALARCDDHQPEPAGEDYLSYANPVGYPDTAATCDVIGCINSARLWLTAEERAAFLAGERVFTTARGASLRVSDDLFPDWRPVFDRRPTVADLRALKGRRQLAMRVETLEAELDAFLASLQ